MAQTIESVLKRLEHSKFRSSFHLCKKDIDYINDKGLDVIQKHAQDFISQRLAPADIPNDGKQTPMKGHPVFIAQHATACCCRGCLNKWYHIPKDRPLTLKEEENVVKIIMAWIIKDYKRQNLK